MKSLTERIRTDLTAKILSGIYPPGGKLPTERDYAKQSGVSRVTVRRVYDQLERSGIIVRRRPLGTRVSDTFRAHGGPLESIGLITTLPHTFSGQFVEAVSRRCEELDALLVLGIPEPDTGERQLEIALRMASRGVRDLIVWGADRGFDFSVFERLRILGVNLVFYDQVIPGPFADYVGLDNAGAMRLLLEQAVRDGAQEFFFITYSDLDVDTNAERRNAFETFSHPAVRRREVRALRRDAPNSDWRRLGAELARRTEENGGHTAILAVNAPVLLRLFSAPPQGGRLYCVDSGPELSSLGATGCGQPIREMAEAAVEALQNQRKKGGDWKAEILRFPGRLVIP